MNSNFLSKLSNIVDCIKISSLVTVTDRGERHISVCVFVSISFLAVIEKEKGCMQGRWPKTETWSVGLTRAPIILLARVAWAESPKQA